MTAKQALQSLLERLKDEERRIADEMCDSSSRTTIFVKRSGADVVDPSELDLCPSNQKAPLISADEHLKLMNYQKEIRMHIQAVTNLIKSNDVDYSNFPIITNIELATRLASCGKKIQFPTKEAASL